jgi:GNAT superfamily N-acetyltransferase
LQHRLAVAVHSIPLANFLRLFGQVEGSLFRGCARQKLERPLVVLVASRQVGRLPLPQLVVDPADFATPEEFLASLDLRVRVFEAAPEHVARITQLVNKTNQFNLTTIRRDQAEVRRLMAASDYRVYGMSVQDRFGDYGLTGAAIVLDVDSWCEIDTLLLSCRILGRGVETAFLAALTRAARGRGRREMVARFVATAKNAPAADFLPRHGFERDPTGRWRAAVAAVPPVPGHVNLAAEG